MLCTGRPYFFIHFKPAFSKPFLALLSHATAGSGSSHLFVGGSRPLPLCWIYRKPYLSCLTSYPGKISHSNSANRELSNDVLVVVVRRRKVAVHTLCQLKRDEALFPPLPISLADRNGLKNLPREIFSACVKFGGNPCRDVDTLHFYTHTHTHTHTYKNEIIYKI